jgi:hypothetical protein
MILSCQENGSLLLSHEQFSLGLRGPILGLLLSGIKYFPEAPLPQKFGWQLGVRKKFR